MAFTYTVGVRSPFWPFFKKYVVVGHAFNSELSGAIRLALNLPDGSAIMVPEADKKYFKVFPDFHVRNEYAKKLKDEPHAAIQD